MDISNLVCPNWTSSSNPLQHLSCSCLSHLSCGQFHPSSCSGQKLPFPHTPSNPWGSLVDSAFRIHLDSCRYRHLAPGHHLSLWEPDSSLPLIMAARKEWYSQNVIRSWHSTQNPMVAPHLSRSKVNFLSCPLRSNLSSLSPLPRALTSVASSAPPSPSISPPICYSSLLL